MVFGKIFSKNIPYNSNIWNYNAQFIFWAFLSECLLYFLLFFLSRLVILLFIFLLINIYYKYNQKKFIEDDNVSVGEKQTDIDNEEEVKQPSEYIKEFI